MEKNTEKLILLHNLLFKPTVSEVRGLQQSVTVTLQLYIFKYVSSIYVK